jgi:hypothetical protein
MSWSKVGDWLKDNAGSGVALVGSLVTGNVPAAIAAGVSLISSATGTNNPDAALQVLQSDPTAMLKLKELYYQNEEQVRQHIETMHRLELEDAQAEHHETQETIRAGDKSEDRLVRWTRPLQSWFSLISAFIYVFDGGSDTTIIGLLLTLPWAYAGLRQIGKGFDTWKSAKIEK